MGDSHLSGTVYADNFVGGGLPGTNPFTKHWYVNGATGLGSDDNPGTIQDPFATIGKAIAAGAAGDDIHIARATYTITAALVPKAFQRFLAGAYNPLRPQVIITGNIAELIQIDVDGVEFYGIEIKASGDTVDRMVDIADAVAVDGLVFDGCVFNGADKVSVIALNASDAVFALTRLVVQRCLFRDLTGTMINIGVLGFAYSLIRNNQFAIDVNSGVGIALADTAAFATGKGYQIVDNLITGFDSTADEVFVTIAGTENATGAGIISRNYGAYVAAAMITIDKLSLSEVNNYYGDAATGGTLVDPGT